MKIPPEIDEIVFDEDTDNMLFLMLQEAAFGIQSVEPENHLEYIKAVMREYSKDFDITITRKSEGKTGR